MKKCIIFLLMAFCLISCDVEGGKGVYMVPLSQDLAYFSLEGGEIEVTYEDYLELLSFIVYKKPYELKSEEISIESTSWTDIKSISLPWVRVEYLDERYAKSYGVRIIVSKNDTNKQRICTILLSCAKNRGIIDVVQEAGSAE